LNISKTLKLMRHDTPPREPVLKRGHSGGTNVKLAAQ
jgi:hypothetical protein